MGRGEEPSKVLSFKLPLPGRVQINCLKGENFMTGRELVLLPFFFFALEKYVGLKEKESDLQ